MLKIIEIKVCIGVVLYPWEAVVTSDSSESSSKNYYQCLVDNRDAEMLPMELETLRVPEERQSKKEVKVSEQLWATDLSVTYLYLSAYSFQKLGFGFTQRNITLPTCCRY